MKKAILIPVIMLMVSGLSLSTPLSCHHGATALFHIMQHANHVHLHDYNVVERELVLLLPARMALYGLRVSIAPWTPASEAQAKMRRTVTSPGASDELVTVRQIPDTASVFPVLGPVMSPSPLDHVYDSELGPTTWMGLGLDPPPRYIV